jgi:hypothetical protein
MAPDPQVISEPQLPPQPQMAPDPQVISEPQLPPQPQMAPDSQVILEPQLPPQPQMAPELQPQIVSEPQLPPQPQMAPELQPQIVSAPVLTQQVVPVGTISPIESTLNQFVPAMTDQQQQICKFSPGTYDAFIKTIQLVDNNAYINIIDSQICTPINKGLATLSVNLKPIIKTDLSITILNPTKVLRSLKQVKGNNDVFIIDDPSQSRYIITNGHLKVFIAKQINETIENIIPPQIQSASLIGSQVIIDKITAATINNLVSKEESINILIHQGIFKGIHIPEVAIFLFEPYISENINETTAEYLLKSYAFLPLSSIETYNIQIYELNGVHYIVHVCDTGLLKINTIENIILVSNDVLI